MVNDYLRLGSSMRRFVHILLFSIIGCAAFAQGADKKISSLNERLSELDRMYKSIQDSLSDRSVNLLEDSIVAVNASLLSLSIDIQELDSVVTELEQAVAEKEEHLRNYNIFVQELSKKRMLERSSCILGQLYSQIDTVEVDVLIAGLESCIAADGAILSVVEDLKLSKERNAVLNRCSLSMERPFYLEDVIKYQKYYADVEKSMSDSQLQEFNNYFNQYIDYYDSLCYFESLMKKVNAALAKVNNDDEAAAYAKFERVIDQEKINIEKYVGLVPYIHKVYTRYVDAMKKNPLFDKADKVVYKTREEYLKGVAEDVESGDAGRIVRAINHMVLQTK